jgi:RNA polymerase sigma factor for flagellar operon FliA
MTETAQQHITTLSPVAMKELVQSYYGLVKVISNAIIARNVRPSALTPEDIYQFGILGLLDAVDRYDVQKGVKFETFAAYRIKGAILDGLRSADMMPRSFRKKERETANAFSSMAAMDPAQLGSSKLKMTVDQYHQFLSELGETIMTHSVHSELSDGVLEALPDDESNNPFEIVSSQQLRELLVEAIQRLPERERLIVLLYYYEGLTFREIGKVLHISESRVFQIHSAAISVLHSALVETAE